MRESIEHNAETHSAGLHADQVIPIVAAARGVALGEASAEHAPSRTDLAEDRTILANERTFAGWMRTSLASLAIGVGFHALFQKLDPPWLPKLIATAFLLLAIAVIVMAEWRAAAVMRRLSPHVVITARPVNLSIFAAVISLGAAALALGIWLLDLG